MADMIKPASSGGNLLGSLGQSKAERLGESTFKDALSSLKQAAMVPGSPKGPSSLKFSNHAIERMASRGISYSPTQLDNIESAIDRAAAKGSKQTLLLTDNSAMIISVNNKTVVTVMDKANLKENVFTNIDSTVVI